MTCSALCLFLDVSHWGTRLGCGRLHENTIWEVYNIVNCMNCVYVKTVARWQWIYYIKILISPLLDEEYRTMGMLLVEFAKKMLRPSCWINKSFNAIIFSKLSFIILNYHWLVICSIITPTTCVWKVYNRLSDCYIEKTIETNNIHCRLMRYIHATCYALSWLLN